ncbi:DUF4476 domain-containing protein [Mucilaginibacter mali]|uniref:DUF4476 domain-containing protein n=1 Tax=Mucilaginibacter mali TaxID=2740462 RepID=A0A7D4UPM9_9SPHI|nr:DUF4476 domain-containing protein [Mucilaginibacter mali]QKJ30820.1 DUF4476 domain-containing protein [Mucilaginibacter mali]
MKKIMVLILVLGTTAATYAQDFNNNRADYGRPYAQRYRRILSPGEFARMQDMIKREPFKDGKRNIFKLALQGRYLLVDQLNDVLKQITFDDEKLDWALMAYPFTADTQHFYQLRDKFSFISTRDKFDQFLQTAVDNDRPRRKDVFSRDEFARLQVLVNKEPFKDSKKKLIEAALQRNLVTVAQVSELLRQFTFDDDKLDVALMAYNYTVDIQKYYLLRDQFTFLSSKEKLDKFLLSAG